VPFAGTENLAKLIEGIDVIKLGFRFGGRWREPVVLRALAGYGDNRG
jgi:hypothetical protein